MKPNFHLTNFNEALNIQQRFNKKQKKEVFLLNNLLAKKDAILSEEILHPFNLNSSRRVNNSKGHLRNNYCEDGLLNISLLFIIVFQAHSGPSFRKDPSCHDGYGWNGYTL
jgi:hypothetical protein